MTTETPDYIAEARILLYGAGANAQPLTRERAERVVANLLRQECERLASAKRETP